MRHAALIGALCAVCVTACSEDTGPNISGVPDLDIKRVTISPTLDTMFVADTLRPTDRLQMNAEVIGRLGTPIPSAAVAWSSSNTQVATVTEGGLVVPTGYGTTTIMASASQVAKATIVVMPAARSVVITPASDTIFVEDPIAARDSIKLVAKALDEKGAVIQGVAFAWVSAGVNTVTVNAAGIVAARGLGVVNVTATSGDRVGTASVRVASAVKSIQVASPVATVLARDTVQLSATALGYDDKPMTGRTFTWTSSNASVATVDEKGRAIFLRAGPATFTAKSALTTSQVTVTALERQFQLIDAGPDLTCGFTNLGRGYCWGSGPLAASPDSTCFGEASGKQPCILSPKRFDGPTLAFTTLSVGATSGCGITTDKLVYCWGSDNAGQIGNGGKGGGTEPTLATVAQVRFDSVAVGGEHACAISTAGQVYCWGRDVEGQLGDRRRVNSTTPIPVNSNLVFTNIAAGGRHTCGIAAGGSVYCWGDNTSGQLGIGTIDQGVDQPVAVSTTENFVAIAAGARHTCALTTTGNAVCWGANISGQAGPGTVGGIAPAPVSVGSESFRRISAAANHSCAITSAGAAYCWGGDADEGGVGNSSPTAVGGGLAFNSITAGDRHTCGIAANGETYCWGSNVYGALGNELQAAFRPNDPQKVAVPR